MAQKESKRTIYNKIINILQKNGIGVWRLYLFGSCEKDRFSPDSDIDLAIFLNTDNSEVIDPKEILGRGWHNSITAEDGTVARRSPFLLEL